MTIEVAIFHKRPDEVLSIVKELKAQGLTQGINSALDRLAGFAFKEAAERAQREGAQYGRYQADVQHKRRLHEC